MTGTTKTAILKARSETKFCVRSRRQYGGETKELLLLPQACSRKFFSTQSPICIEQYDANVAGEQKLQHQVLLLITQRQVIILHSLANQVTIVFLMDIEY